ncbi:pilus assembly FimT family protein [Hydrogenophaga sp. R2]|uniref:pilus assembly FimT family protein n=1 Tax=Hydrogenophaga sp. R2 TaxID=3132827 RepID=UPI003CF2287B
MKQPTTPLRFACARGLSLIETMVAVAILGSMVAMAAPSFARIGERYRVSGVQSDLEATLHAARVEAVTPSGRQAADACGTFWLDHTGARSQVQVVGQAVPASADECWSR